MRVDIQWTTDRAAAWISVDSRDWPNLPSKPLPRGGERIDNQPGWIESINIQGVHFRGDHYAVTDRGDHVEVAVWSDDQEDQDRGWHYARVWKFWPVVGGVTRQEKTLYPEADIGQRLVDWHPGGIQDTEIKTLQEFVPPSERFIRHGIWVPDQLQLEHEAFPMASFRDWETIPPVQGGAPSITYLLNAPDASDSDCTPAADFNRKMDEAGQQSENLTASMTAGADKLTHAFTTQAGDPNVVDWPVASGGDPYGCTIEVGQAGGDVTYGLLTIGGSNGEFVRVNSSCTRQEGWVQSQSVFSGTGSKTATNTTVNPSSGAAGDRYQVRWAAARAASHGTQNFRIDVGTGTNEAVGPWVGEVAPDMAWPSGPEQVMRRKREVVSY